MNTKAHIQENRIATFSNVDKNGNLKPIEAARWFQDLFVIQDKILGKEKNDDYGWILLNYDMNIYKYPKYKEEVIVETYPYSFNKFYGNRIFLIKDKKDNILIEAKSKWLYVNRKTFKIKRITPEITNHFYIKEISKGKGFQVDSFDNINFDDIKPNKLNIRYNDLDMNNHINNTIYFGLLYDYIDKSILEQYEAYKIQISYKKQIKLNDDIAIYVKDTVEAEQKYTYIKMSDKKEDHTYIKILWKKKDEY